MTGFNIPGPHRHAGRKRPSTWKRDTFMNTCAICGLALERDTPDSPPYDTTWFSLYCPHTGERHITAES